MNILYIPKKKSVLTNVKYGLLYNRYAATDERNIMPAGWRVANDNDFEILVDYVGANGDYTSSNTIAPYLKDTQYWVSGLEGNNQYGFNLRGAGFRLPEINSIIIGFNARLISGVIDNSIHCWVYNDYSPVAFFRGSDPLVNLGFSIRAIKENSTDTGTMTGNDGKVYSTVKIGNQVWIAANLAETKYRNGDLIPEVTDDATWYALTTGALCAANNDWNNV